MTFASLLTQVQTQLYNDASLEILEDVGWLVRYEKARTIFANHGCIVDSEKKISLISGAGVLRNIAR